MGTSTSHGFYPQRLVLPVSTCNSVLRLLFLSFNCSAQTELLLPPRSLYLKFPIVQLLPGWYHPLKFVHSFSLPKPAFSFRLVARAFDCRSHYIFNFFWSMSSCGQIITVIRD